MEQQEIWKDVIGYESFYEVNNLGVIRSKSRKCPGGRGSFHIRKPKLMTIRKDKHSYLRVGLTGDGITSSTKQVLWLVHRVVALAFIPNPENKPMVNHINGIKGDCKVENLEWVTRKENARHAFDTGLQVNPKGQDHRMAKLTEEQVLQIREKYRPNRVYGSTKLSREFNISVTNIKDIINRRIWNHI